MPIVNNEVLLNEAAIISALDANKKLLDSIDATTEQINKNWEEYKASHPEIFGNI